MGVTSIVVAVGGAVMALIDNDPATNPSWEALGAAIMAGVGLIFARDNGVTSTDLGLHKPPEGGAQ